MRAVNLIPNDQRRGGYSVGVGAGRSEGAAYAVLGLVVCVALLAFLYGHAKHQVSNRKGEAASLKAKAQTLQGEVSSLSPYTAFIKLREEREQAVASLVDSRFDWAHAFHEFGRVLPHNVSINSLDGAIAAGSGAPSAAASTTSSSATSATPPGSVPNFTIAGCAASQRAVATMLQRLRLIDGVAEVSLQSSTKGAAGASGGGATGSCGGSQAAFTATVTYQALPATAEAAAAATGKSSASTVSNSSGAATPTPATGGAQ